jgi:pimeloyl-ACP methyl ester carboxylesterase
MTLTPAAMESPAPANGPITIEGQGSFFVGGRKVSAAGRYDGTASSFPPNAGQTFWVDHMYVQYQIPPNPRKLPIVLVHGGGGTGRVWESTPDGREGYQTIFLRRGFAVYIVDAPRGGRSGFPSFNGDFGQLDETQPLVPAQTRRPGREHGWTRWRLGPVYPEVYADSAFPIDAIDAFFQHLRPLVSDDPALIGAALVALFERIGPAILVTHSNSGLWGWLAGADSPHVKAIVSYEPGVVFPRDAMPSPLPLFKGQQDAGSPVSAQAFARLAQIPIQVVFGDHIPTQPVADLLADGRRAQVIAARLFAAALNAERCGGQASVQLLPEVGLRGNSHFMFSDRNNVQVADQLSAFLAAHGLDAF